jgi:predicted nucleotidyltransferase
MGTTSGDLLGTVLFGRTRRAVLAMLYGHPDESFYVRQIGRAAGVGQGALQRELAQLTRAGILTRTVQGKQVYYRANRDCPVYEELRGLLLKTVGVADVLREALRGLEERVCLALIYGSVAAGDETRASDVDILIAGDVTFAEAVTALDPAQRRLLREVNPTVYPEKEFRKKLRDGHGFLSAVVRGPKVFIVGGEDDLARLAE